MILIADSGSSKTHWRLILSNGNYVDFTSQGLNPFFTSTQDYQKAIASNFPPGYNVSEVEKLFFYGSGCAAAEKANEVLNKLRPFFSKSTIEIHSDILAAARALFGLSSGLVVILGSGTNVGFYNGKVVTHQTPSLGYVLGDEGSGAYLGKKLVKYWQYNELPEELIASLRIRYSLSLNDILSKVYSEPYPNRFLAGFVPFLAENSSHPFIDGFILKAFTKLMERHIERYDAFPEFPVGVVGSVGALFQDKLKRVIQAKGGTLATIARFPIDGLTNFHLNNGL